jgi:hypothetical protein
VTAGWVRSSRCIQGDCVEVRYVGGVVEVRDSKQPGGPVLRYGIDEWRYVVDAAKLDATRDPNAGWVPGAFLRLDDGQVDLVQSTTAGTAVLTVDRGDWDAFLMGVCDGEFDAERLTATASGQDAGV